jgi:hypothetical protein
MNKYGISSKLKEAIHKTPHESEARYILALHLAGAKLHEYFMSSNYRYKAAIVAYMMRNLFLLLKDSNNKPLNGEDSA